MPAEASTLRLPGHGSSMMSRADVGRPAGVRTLTENLSGMLM